MYATTSSNDVHLLNSEIMKLRPEDLSIDTIQAIPYGAHGFGFKNWNRVLFFYINPCVDNRTCTVSQPHRYFDINYNLFHSSHIIKRNRITSLQLA